MRLIDADKIDFSEIIIGNSGFAKHIKERADVLINLQPTAYDFNYVME